LQTIKPSLLIKNRWTWLYCYQVLEIMASTGQVVEGAGGQTFVATGGSGAFTSAAKGSVYAEFQVPTSSLIQGGQANWFKILGPNAKASQQFILNKQGGELLPKVQNLTKILETK
jgi:hypothetical protein